MDGRRRDGTLSPDGFSSDAGSAVALAEAGRSVDEPVLVPCDVLSGTPLQHQASVDGGCGVEVELSEEPVLLEPGAALVSDDRAPSPSLDLVIEQKGEEVEGAEPLGSEGEGSNLGGAEHAGEPEFLEPGQPRVRRSSPGLELADGVVRRPRGVRLVGSAGAGTRSGSSSSLTLGKFVTGRWCGPP